MSYRALIVERTGEGGGAVPGLREMPALETGQVLIEVYYSSLNYKDALALAGHPGIVRRTPLAAGIDAAGVIVESRDRNRKTGERVVVTGYQLSQTHDGGYAEYLAVPGDWVVPLPDGLDLYQAMALGTAGFTAGRAMQRLLDNHQSPELGPVLVTGATGGVGGFAVNILSKLGFEVTALTGKPDYNEYLQALGAADVLDRRTLEPGGAPLERGRWGGAVDNLGGDILAWLTRTVVPHGNIAAVGLAAGTALNTTVMPFILRGVALLGIDSALCPMPLRREIWRQLAGPWRPALERVVSGTLALEQVIEIAARMRAGEISGRYVVAVKAGLPAE